MIKVLDCTLRDGGYVNDWKFGNENIRTIISGLLNAKIDYVECGFLKEVCYDKSRTIFSSCEQLTKISNSKNLCLMINYGEYDFSRLPQNSDITLRVAFKKHDFNDALEYCKKLKEKGFKIFINPMVTDSYTKSELKLLITTVNEIKPIALTIADTIGEMTTKDIETLFTIIDKYLDTDISICFHSHNNIQMSFANTQRLIELSGNRDLIIDSSIFGMGRGAGNLCTELITKYLNRYNMSEIMAVSKENIMPIYETHPWGCSAESYLAAINHCHPNYVTFMSDKNLTAEDMNKIFQLIPDDKKTIFDKSLIENLILQI